MADRARFWGRVGGIFHTDELPAYGITEEEIEGIRRITGAEGQDAIVFVADNPENARDALKAVVERAREALRGVPEETRAANPDGTTRYMRPRPGAARMYPETDIPPTRVTEEQINKIRANLPELPEQKLERLMKEYKLNQKLAKQILDSEYSQLFEIIVRESNVSPTTVAAFLTETLKALEREGILVGKVSEEQMRRIFKCLSLGELTKEALPDIVGWLSRNEGKSVEEAMEELGLKMLSKFDIEKIVEATIEANKKLIEERGANAFGALMGIIMKEVRGKANAGLVSEILRRKLESYGKS
jgi:glutamyl-tRNA(Gln) amidotransferase subunit E